MKYTAINIGPIISTLGMARKPGELWAASYLFSHLMKWIYQTAEEKGLEIISPAKPSTDMCEVGIYPDRIFIKGSLDTAEFLHDAMEGFLQDFSQCEATKALIPDLNYFNLMATHCEADKESSAIDQLSHQLDVLELFNYAKEDEAAETIYKIISKEGSSLLYKLATGKKPAFKSIEDIAKIGKRGEEKVAMLSFLIIFGNLYIL